MRLTNDQLATTFDLILNHAGVYTPEQEALALSVYLEYLEFPDNFVLEEITRNHNQIYDKSCPQVSARDLIKGISKNIFADVPIYEVLFSIEVTLILDCNSYVPTVSCTIYYRNSKQKYRSITDNWEITHES
jgi:hypothetical protein